MPIHKFLKPPIYEDLEKNRIANLMHLILLFNGTFIIFLLFGFIVFGLTEIQDISPIIISLILYGVFYGLLKKGFVNLSAFLFVIVSYLVLTIVTIIYGGVQAPHLFLYFVTIVIASAVLREAYAIAVYVLVMVSAIVIYLIEKAGLLPNIYQPILGISSLIVLGTNLVIMGGIIYLSNRNFRQTLALYTNELETRRKAEKEIRQLNIELEQRVKDRTAALEYVNKELESFSYSVSHDLRAPLRTISGYSSIVFENFKKKIDDESIGYLTKIMEATTKMDSMIIGLLDLSTITRKDIQTDTVNLSKLVQEITNDLPFRESSQEVEINIAKNINVLGDERLLRVLMSNLINNAWKFTRDREKVQIEFSVKEDDGQQIFFVKDNGVGFDNSYAQNLFTPFHRLHSETEFEGTGIGLATCMKIVQRHGGNLWGEAEVGKGATFYFTLANEKSRIY